jgi:hypothetical protein
MENCIHCDHFMPVWKKLSGSEQKNIGFAEYERSQLDSAGDEGTVNGKPVMGFPTIKINVMDREYNYQGERTETAILGFVRDKLKNRFNGVESEVESERSDRSLFSEMAGGNSSSENVQFGGQGDEGENRSPNVEEEDDGENETEATTEDVVISSEDEEGEEGENDTLKGGTNTSEDDVSTVEPPADSEKYSSIFAKRDVEEQTGGGDFRMSEFDRLLMKEINILSELPGF